MTTTDRGVTLALPYRHHWLPSRRGPAETAAQSIEDLLAVWADTDDDRLIDVLHRTFRPDLTHAQLFETIEQLCALSADAAHAQHAYGRLDVAEDDGGPGRWSAREAFDAASEAYVAALLAFARPDDAMALADAVQAVTDARRAVRLALTAARLDMEIKQLRERVAELESGRATVADALRQLCDDATISSATGADLILASEVRNILDRAERAS